LAFMLTDQPNPQAPILAQTLMRRFGSIASLFDRACQGFQPAVTLPVTVASPLRGLVKVESTGSKSSPERTIPLDDVNLVAEHLRRDMVALPVEVFRVLFLDGANRLLSDQIMSVGTIDRVQVYVREVVRQALALDAIALVVSHNHVSTPPTPSEDDIVITARLLDACAPFDLRLNDHIIVSREGFFSMRGHGLLDQLEQDRTVEWEQAA